MPLDPSRDLSSFKVYVLIAYEKKPKKREEEEDEFYSKYYDKPEFVADVKEWFNDLKCEWAWTPVTMFNMREVIKMIISDPKHLVSFLYFLLLSFLLYIKLLNCYSFY